MDEDNLEIVVTPGNWQISEDPRAGIGKFDRRSLRSSWSKASLWDQNTMLMMRRKRLKQSCWRGSGRPNDCRVAQAQSFGDPHAGSLTQHQVGPFAARADGEKKDCCVPDGCTAPRN